MHASEVLIEILLSRKSLSSMTLAIGMWAIQLLSRTAMLIVNLAFVSKETPGVSEAG
jgi:hydrogenase/urease accessory protein HupE